MLSAFQWNYRRLFTSFQFRRESFFGYFCTLSNVNLFHTPMRHTARLVYVWCRPTLWSVARAHDICIACTLRQLA